MAFGGFGGFKVFGKASLGHPLPFSCDFHQIPHGSPKVPLAISFESPQIPHSSLGLLLAMSFGCPSDFPQFPDAIPYHFPFQSHQIHHRFLGVSLTISFDFHQILIVFNGFGGFAGFSWCLVVLGGFERFLVGLPWGPPATFIWLPSDPPQKGLC